MKPNCPPKPALNTEYSNWKALPEGQKSFAVQVMHYFRYRTRLIPSSWTREEVLTWELYRALQVLPRSLLLEPLMRLCATTGSDAAATMSELLRDASNVKLVAYPRLRLDGNRRNSASDLGFFLHGNDRVWIEAKTAVVKPKVLTEQLQTQRERIRELSVDASTVVVALLPVAQEGAFESSIRWTDIVVLLEGTLQSLRDHPSSELTGGLILVANELRERVLGHDPLLVT